MLELIANYRLSVHSIPKSASMWLVRKLLMKLFSHENISDSLLWVLDVRYLEGGNCSSTSCWQRSGLLYLL